MPGAGARRRQGGSARPCSTKSAALMAQGAQGMVYGRNIYQHDNPKARGRGADGDDPQRRRRRRGLGHLQPWLSGGPYLLGLDAGNTVIKAVLFDAAGRQLARARASTAHRTRRRPAMSSAIVDELWANARAAIRGCLADGRHRSAPTSPQSAAPATATGSTSSTATARRCSASSRSTRRAAGLAEELRRRGNGDAHARDLPAAALAVADADAARLAEAAPRRRSMRAPARCCSARTVVTWHLTGDARQRHFRHVAAPGCCACRRRVYDAGLLALYGLDDAQAAAADAASSRPSIVGAVTAEAAAATGLAEGTPVVGGLFDVVAQRARVGRGRRRAQASIIVGTWSINQVFSAAPVRDARVFMVVGLRPGPLRQHGDQRHLGRQPRMVCARAGRARRPPRRSVRRSSTARVGDVTPAADDPLLPPLPLRLAARRHQRARLLRARRLARRGAPAARAVRGRRVRASPPYRGAAPMPASASTAPRSPAAARAAPIWPQMFADGLGIPVTVAEAARDRGARRGDRRRRSAPASSPGRGCGGRAP